MQQGLLAHDGLPTTDGAGVVKRGRRVYFIDWMRVVAIYLVVTYHVIQALVWVRLFDHISGMDKFVVSFRAAALQIGMPMFFHISGRAHAVSPPMGFRRTFLRRVQRLLVPFAVCYVLLIPPWQFISMEYDWHHPSSFHMKSNPITWLFQYYTTWRFLIDFNLAWLWFLPALFLIVVLSTPLFLLAERHGGEKKRSVYTLMTALLWLGLALSLVLCGFTWSFGMFAVLGPFAAVAMAHFAPLPFRGQASSGPAPHAACELSCWCAGRLVTIIQIVADVGLVVSFGYQDIDPPRADGSHDPRAAIPFLVLCTGFYVQGYFSHRWSQGCGSLDSDSAPWWVLLYRLVAAFGILLTIMVSSPLGDVETGHYIYPIYSASYEDGSGFGAVYVLGTWCYIGVFVSLFQAYGDNIIRPDLYKHATASTLVVYIFHWVFVKVFAFWMLEPTLWRQQLIVTNVWVALVLVVVAYVFAIGGSLGVYALVLRVPCLRMLFGI